MEDQFYCLRCGKYHPQSEKVIITTAKGERRLSCVHRVNAKQGNQATRDAFGKTVTERNKALSKEISKRSINPNHKP